MEPFKNNNSTIYVLRHFFAYFIGFCLIAAALWTRKYFGSVTVYQAVATFHFGMEGLFASDSAYIRRFIVWCFVWPMLIASLLTGLRCFLMQNRMHTSSKIRVCLRCINIMSHYAIFVLVGIASVAFEYSIIDYLKRLRTPETDYFAANYHDPKTITFKANQPKNLVIIYVESLEKTYSNPNLFGHDLLAPLNQFHAAHTFSITDYKQMPSTGWTIAAIVATQCGIPLKELTIIDSNHIGQNVNTFLPNVKCLSDILAEYDYKNIFMGGASTKFSGKIKFLQAHHYTEIDGKEEWLAQGIPESTMNDWGLPDHNLFQQAKVKLTQLMSTHQRFNLTILTVDTHGYNGQLSPYCKQQGYRNFTGVVECTVKDVTDFVNYIASNGWLDRVNVVILGDHLAMKNAVYDKLSSVPNRSIYNLFISQEPHYKRYDQVMVFSMLPTILNFIGFNFNSDKVALGYSGIGATPGTRPVLYISEMEKNIDNYSQSYAHLWLNKKI